MSSNAVVIVAAGRGSRMGSGSSPKQYLDLEGECVLARTIRQFAGHPEINHVQVVIHADDHDVYGDLIKPHDKLLPPVNGGATRQASCKAGIDHLPPDVKKVLIHDAARPFVSASTITNVLEGISENICALPASAIADTVKKADKDGSVIETVDRTDLYLAQTPQGFLLGEIEGAHGKAAEQNLNDFTDDAAVAEWAGLKVRLVEGNKENTKITTVEDLEAARKKLAMENRIADVRTGSGYDIHTLGPGDGVILCGVKVPHDQSLQGHSDADVGLHALTDALLGTIGAGDIGSHFPPSDAKWKGANSDQFLLHALSLVKDAGGTITNMDVTIICEAPKIGPHRDTMRAHLAELCGLELNRISVKATTNEKIGAIGREEGIAALASTTVVFQ